MRVPYSPYELKARLTPCWNRVKKGSLKIVNGEISGLLDSVTVNASEWTDPPHLALANLGYGADHHRPSDEEVRTFYTRYGPLGLGMGVGDVSPEQTEDVHEPPRFGYLLDLFYSFQQRLRRAWETGDPEQLTHPSYKTDIRSLLVSWKAQRNGLVVEARSCMDYMGLRLASDLAKGHAKRCARRDCPFSPYFISVRSDSLYCSHPCASHVSVMRYRAQEKDQHLKRQKVHRRKR